MKERLFTLVCAIGALALFLAMFVRGGPTGATREDVSRPTSAERRANGYFAARTWLESTGVRTLSWRDRYALLADAKHGLAPTGNLLIVTLPAVTRFETEEFRPLDRWIRAGNTVLVLAALADNPDWAAARAGLANADLNLLTGLEFESLRARGARVGAARAVDAAHIADAERMGDAERTGDAERSSDPKRIGDAPLRELATPLRSALRPSRPHPWFDGVREAIALSDFPRQSWALKVPFDAFALELAREPGGAGVLWTRPLGAGRIVASGYGSLFTNRALGLGDNARLLGNLVAASVGPRGAVLFDDLHQGLGAAYDPQQFFRDPRLYATIGVLLATWLAWVLGATRLRTPAAERAAPREAELLVAAGNLFARVLPRRAAAERLLQHFIAGLRVRAGLADEQHAWEWLAQQPRVAPLDLERLRALASAASAGRRVPLAEIHNLIVRIARQVA